MYKLLCFILIGVVGFLSIQLIRERQKFKLPPTESLYLYEMPQQ